MNIERSQFIRRGALAIALCVASNALLACSSEDKGPEEVQKLRLSETVAAAKANIKKEQIDTLEADGLTGYHKLQLVKPKREESTSTWSSGEYESKSGGLFILVAGGTSSNAEGSYQSETSTTVTRFVRLAWDVNNETNDTLVSDFPVEKIIVRDATETTGIALEFALNPDALIDYEGSLERKECIFLEERKNKDPEEHFVPAQPGCMQGVDFPYADDYLRHGADKGLVDRVVLYLDEDSRNQYFTAIGDI